MAEFDVEIATPVLPITAASPDGDILRLQEWLVVRGISVGETAAAPGSAAAVGIDGDFGPATQAGCATFAAAAGLANATVDATFWQALTNGMRSAFNFQAAQPTIADAVVETAPISSSILSRLAASSMAASGADRSGPWAPCLLPRLFRSMVPGRRVAVGEAGFRHARPAAAVPSRWRRDLTALRSLDRQIGEQEQPSRGGFQSDARPAGSFFFVRGMLGR